VEGTHAGVAGLHCLEGDGAFNAADFTNDDKVRPLPEGGLEQVEHRDLRGFILFAGATGTAAYPVMMRYLDFRGVFNTDNLGFRRYESSERIHQGGLTRGRLSGYPGVHTFLENNRKIGRHIVVQGAELDELQYAQGRVAELPDGEVTAALGNIGAVDDVDTRAIGQGGVDDGLAEGNGVLDALGEFDDELVQCLVGIKAEQEMSSMLGSRIMGSRRPMPSSLRRSR
jgi:hypothetical protein